MGFTKRHIHICLQEGYDKAFIEPNGELHAIHFMKDGKESCECSHPLHEGGSCPDHRVSFTLVVKEREGKQVHAAILVGEWPMHSPALIKDKQGYRQRWFNGVQEAARAALDRGFF